MNIDLSSLNTSAACDAGAEIELLHPTTREPLGQFITVLGKDSKAFRDYVARNANADRRKAFEAARRQKPQETKTFEQSQDEGTELLVVCTTRFRSKDGAFLRYPTNSDTFPFSADNARKLYTEQLWIRAQIDEAIVDLENFIKS